MQSLLLAAFSVSLLSNLCLFLAEFLYWQIKHLISLAFFITLFVGTVFFTLKLKNDKKILVIEEPKKQAIRQNSLLAERIKKEKLASYSIIALEKNLKEELSRYQSLASLQETHRDVLINLSILYSALNDEVQANFYLEKAKIVDPNFVLF